MVNSKKHDHFTDLQLFMVGIDFPMHLPYHLRRYRKYTLGVFFLCRSPIFYYIRYTNSLTNLILNTDYKLT